MSLRRIAVVSWLIVPRVSSLIRKKTGIVLFVFFPSTGIFECVPHAAMRQS